MKTLAEKIARALGSALSRLDTNALLEIYKKQNLSDYRSAREGAWLATWVRIQTWLCIDLVFCLPYLYLCSRLGFMLTWICAGLDLCRFGRVQTWILYRPGRVQTWIHTGLDLCRPGFYIGLWAFVCLYMSRPGFL